MHRCCLPGDAAAAHNDDFACTAARPGTNCPVNCLLQCDSARVLLQPDAYVASLEVRQHYPTLAPPTLMHTLERYKEVPGQAKKKPDWATKKTTDAAVKQLKAQATAAATASPASARLQDLGELSPSKLPQPFM